MKRLLLAAAALTLLTATSAMAQTVIIVRHAEKVDASADPVLSEAGQARALTLGQGRDDIDYILVTPLQRTQLTAEPTAKASGVTPEIISLDGGVATHVDAIVQRIRGYPADAKVLVVGHSNTVPLIARALGHDTPDMPECEYDRFIVTNVGSGDRVSLTTRYGEPTTCG